MSTTSSINSPILGISTNSSGTTGTKPPGDGPTLPTYTVSEDLKTEEGNYLHDNSKEIVKDIRESFKLAAPKLTKCWEGWNSLLPSEVQLKYYNEFLAVFMTTVEDAKCLHYISDEEKWKRIHHRGSTKKLPIRDQEMEVLLRDLKALRAYAGNTSNPNLERNRAKAGADDTQAKIDGEILLRRFHQTTQNMLLELLAVKDTLTTMLKNNLPPMGGSILNILPKEAPQLSVLKKIRNRRVMPEPSTNGTEELREAEVLLMTADTETKVCCKMPWTRFMVFEDYLAKVTKHFDMVHPQDLRSNKASLLSRENKKYKYFEDRQTFQVWWNAVNSTLNIFNGTDEELTDHEKVFFLVNNTGHVPWFQTLTSFYNNIDIRRTPLDFESVKSQYADEDVNHWMFHQKPATSSLITGVNFSETAQNEVTLITTATGDTNRKPDGNRKKKNKHPNQRKQRQEEKVSNKGGGARGKENGRGGPKDRSERGGRSQCPACGKPGHSMKDCWLLQNFKENQKKRADQTGRNRGKGRDDSRNKPDWRRDKGITFEVAARSNPCVVTKGPVQPRPPDRQPPSAPLAAAGNAQTLPATDSGVPPGKILLDSGATFTAVNKPMPGVEKIKNSDWTMTFGNGHVAPIEQLGSIGGLKDVAICKGMHVAVASVSHLAKDLGCICLPLARGPTFSDPEPPPT